MANLVRKQYVFFLPELSILFALFILNACLFLGIINNPYQGKMLSGSILIPVFSIVFGYILLFSIEKVRSLYYKISKISKSEREVYSQRRLFVVTQKLIRLLIFFTIAIAFINTKLLYINTDLTRTSDDTRDIVGVAAFSPLDFHFWTGYKPPLLPLLIRSLGYTNGLEDHVLFDKVGLVQVYLSIIAWLFFAWSFSIHLQRYLSKLLSWSILLFFSASLDISLWDRLTLTESLSTSSFVLFLGCISIFLYCLFHKIKYRYRIISFILIIISSIIYALARDTNVYFVAAISILLYFWSWFKYFPRINRVYIHITSSLLISIFLLHSYTYNISNRWHPVIINIMKDRISTNPDAIQYFVQSGMPSVDNILEGSNFKDISSYLDSMRFRYITGDKPGTFEYWFERQSKKVYMKYLLSNPIQTIISPVKDWRTMLFENNYEYRQPNGMLPKRITLITKALFTYNLNFILIQFFLCLTGFTLIQFNKQVQPAWFLVISMFSTLIPLMILVWVGDFLEIPRHSLQLAIQLRLALFLGLLLLVDFTINTMFNRQYSVNSFRTPGSRVGMISEN